MIFSKFLTLILKIDPIYDQSDNIAYYARYVKLDRNIYIKCQYCNADYTIASEGILLHTSSCPVKTLNGTYSCFITSRPHRTITIQENITNDIISEYTNIISDILIKHENLLNHSAVFSNDLLIDSHISEVELIKQDNTAIFNKLAKMGIVLEPTEYADLYTYKLYQITEL